MRKRTFWGPLLLGAILLPAGIVRAQAPAADTAALKNKGIGPVKSVKIGPLNKELAEQGEKLFESKCTACHKIEERYVGPALRGVTKRRSPEWIMNMILNPVEMVAKDPIAKGLQSEFHITMASQSLTQDNARAIVEYFRSEDEDEDADDAAKPAGEAGTQKPLPRKKLPGT